MIGSNMVDERNNYFSHVIVLDRNSWYSLNIFGVRSEKITEGEYNASENVSLHHLTYQSNQGEVRLVLHHSDQGKFLILGKKDSEVDLERLRKELKEDIGVRI
jgi:hypothetical protein